MFICAVHARKPISDKGLLLIGSSLSMVDMLRRGTYLQESLYRAPSPSGIRRVFVLLANAMIALRPQPGKPPMRSVLPVRLTGNEGSALRAKCQRFGKLLHRALSEQQNA